MKFFIKIALAASILSFSGSSDIHARSCPTFKVDDPIFTQNLVRRGHHQRKFYHHGHWWHILEEYTLFSLEESLLDTFLPGPHMGGPRSRSLDAISYCVYDVRTEGKPFYFAIMSEEDFQAFEGNRDHYMGWLKKNWKKRHHKPHEGCGKAEKKAHKREHRRHKITARRAHEAHRRRAAIETHHRHLEKRLHERADDDEDREGVMTF